MTYRIETDHLGDLKIPKDALWGIHTQRAIFNFPISNRRVNPALIHAFGKVKLACAKVNGELGYLENKQCHAITHACSLMSDGKLDAHIMVDAMQGGAGTSTNMNINEVIANIGIRQLGGQLGDYTCIHPIEHVNLHQSTNDTYPTALKIAAIYKLRKLEKNIVRLIESCQKKEMQSAHIVKIARTQMQDAVLTTMGQSMAAFANAFLRDRNRIHKCEDILRVINLGGTAIGTGVSAPKPYILNVSDELRRLSDIAVVRADNLIDATQNLDGLVEVSGILNALTTNLMKIASDIRLMASGPHTGIGEITLAAKQAGSSIMPAKVNPIIPEATMQAAIKVMSNHHTITLCASLGNLELNTFLPLIADTLLESIDLLCHVIELFSVCIDEMRINEEKCNAYVQSSTAILTALISKIGYKRAEELALQAEVRKISICDMIIADHILSKDELDELMLPEFITGLISK